MHGEKKSNFDLKQYIYIYFPLIIIREINFSNQSSLTYKFSLTHTHIYIYKLISMY